MLIPEYLSINICPILRFVASFERRAYLLKTEIPPFSK